MKTVAAGWSWIPLVSRGNSWFPVWRIGKGHELACIPNVLSIEIIAYLTEKSRKTHNFMLRLEHLRGKIQAAEVMKKITIFICLLFSLSSQAANLSINGLRVWAAPDHTRLVFDTSGPADHSLFSLSNPARLVIDIKKSRLSTKIPGDWEGRPLYPACAEWSSQQRITCVWC